ncbi:hypothetical protein KXW47_005751, partial [Aspergillus fumigatus]
MLSPFFSASALDKFESRVLELILHSFNELEFEDGSDFDQLGKIKYAWGSPKCVSEWSVLLVYKIMSEFVFGREVKANHSKKHGRFLKVRELGAHVATVLYFLPPWAWKLVERLYAPVLRNEISRVENYFNSLPTPDNNVNWKEDIYSSLLDRKAALDDKTLTNKEILAECGILVQAGFETVSGTLSAVLFYLSRNRSAYTRLAHEIRSTFDTLDDIRTGSHLASCLFLTACINETMRISPTSSIALLRE